MTDDLVGRLRVGDYYPDGDIGYHEISPGKVDALCEQAADRIEALQAEIERLREEIARLRGPVTYYKKGYGPSDGYAAIQETDGTFTRSDDT